MLRFIRTNTVKEENLRSHEIDYKVKKDLPSMSVNMSMSVINCKSNNKELQLDNKEIKLIRDDINLTEENLVLIKEALMNHILFRELTLETM